MRPKPPVLIPDAVRARQLLEPLRSAPEDGALLSRTSQILRCYLAAAFALSPGELTTAEFCQAILEHPKPGPELANEIAGFLRASDLRKFAPSAPTSRFGAVDRVMKLIDLSENRLAELNRLSAAQGPISDSNHPPTAGQTRGLASGA